MCANESSNGRPCFKRIVFSEYPFLQFFLFKLKPKSLFIQIHNVDGTRKAIPYGKKDQYINSISRNHLNKLLLNIAQQFPNVRLHFNQKLKSIDFKRNECSFISTSLSDGQKSKDLEFSKLNFELYAKSNSESSCNGHAIVPNGIVSNGHAIVPNGNEKNAANSETNESSVSESTLNDDETGERTVRRADVIIGADGAFSKVRYETLQCTLHQSDKFKFTQC